MSDVVVTVPKNFRYRGKTGLAAWISEGDPAGTKWSGEEWHFYLGSIRPKIEPGDRVYVVCDGRLRGYSPLVRVDECLDPSRYSRSSASGYASRYALVRHGDAVAVAIPDPIPGFRGFRYRWWDREIEIPFPDWRTA